MATSILSQYRFTLEIVVNHFATTYEYIKTHPTFFNEDFLQIYTRLHNRTTTILHTLYHIYLNLHIYLKYIQAVYKYLLTVTFQKQCRIIEITFIPRITYPNG